MDSNYTVLLGNATHLCFCSPSFAYTEVVLKIPSLTLIGQFENSLLMCVENNVHITQTDIEVHLETGYSFNSG